jgi:hypothetical protein
MTETFFYQKMNAKIISISLSFQAAYLPQKYKQGRLIAYQLICEMTVRRQDNPLSEDYLRHFYRCLHDGLTNIDQVR